jgi:transcriptional regulator with XRE-family HTH domain
MGKVKPKAETERKTYIRAWRKFREMKLEQVAEIIGVTAGALSQLERGQTKYTQPMLEALADVYGCEPHNLISFPPGTIDPVVLIWHQIPIEDRAKALDVLKAFTKPHNLKS